METKSNNNISRGDSQPVSTQYHATIESVDGVFTFKALEECDTHTVTLWLRHAESIGGYPNGVASALLVLAARGL